MEYLFIVLIFLMLFAGFPIFLSLGLGSILILVFVGGWNLSTIGLYFFNTIESFPLLAIPLFILSGSLMVDGGSARSLVNLSNAFFGHLPGGLAIATISACAFFAALSGSAFATTAAIGLIMIPAMTTAGYNRGTASGLIACSGNLGNLIPPSIIMILYGALAQYPVSKLFMGGIIPGIVVTILLSITAIIVIRRQEISLQPKATWKERGNAIIKAIPSLMMPIIILGGIYSGVFTPTEAAAIASLYALLIGLFVYRGLTWKRLIGGAFGAMKLTATIFVVLAAAMVMGKAAAFLGVPQAITSLALGYQLSWWAYLLVVFVVLLLLGCVLDISAIIVIGVPILLPAALSLGIDIIHFCMVYVISMMIGAVTPPIGLISYFIAGISKIPALEVFRGSFPFLGAMIVGLLLVLFLPELSTWLPSTMG